MLALTTDGLTLRNVRRLAVAVDLELIDASSLDDVQGQPVAVVIDLEEEAALDGVSLSKERWPKAMVIGVVTMPGSEVWQRAERAGCDLVTTRGAVAKAVPERLERWMAAPGGRRVRLFAMDEIAGRLGLVARLDDPVVGPLAVYHVGGRVCAVRDVCPHADASLSHGEVDVDTGVITCPEHGSRFDACTGDRVRGPADTGLQTFRVIIEDGRAYAEVE